jgi:hypothetical protein
MKLKTAAPTLAIALFSGTSASAHRIDEYLQATLLSLQADRVQASMRMIPGILVASSVISGIDGNGDGVLSDDEERTYAQRVLGDLSVTVDGARVQPKLISWNFPQPAQLRDGIGEIHIEYTLDLPRGDGNRTLILANHHLSGASVYLMNVLVPLDQDIRILAQKRNEKQSFYELDYQQNIAATDTPWSRLRIWLRGAQLTSLFALGMRHIAEGTDHLLFLLVLLLPAPLLVSGSRWGLSTGSRQSLFKIVGIVTAFTIGHSVSLSLAALGYVRVPEQPVEMLIAVSIFVSSLHAFRPLFPGKEAWIAGFFGLIHGLAFAATLERLDLGRWERVAGILAFNVGIETMQMIVVAGILPSLMLMSRTRAYPILRNGGAVLAGAASVGWIVERLLDVETPVDMIINGLARHALWIAIPLFLLSVACTFSRTSGTPRTGTHQSV